MPYLHSPVVATNVPSMSMIAWSKKASGCSVQMRTSSKMSSSAWTSAAVKRRQKSLAVVGSGMRRPPKAVTKTSSLRRSSMSWPSELLAHLVERARRRPNVGGSRPLHEGNPRRTGPMVATSGRGGNSSRRIGSATADDRRRRRHRRHPARRSCQGGWRPHLGGGRHSVAGAPAWRSPASDRGIRTQMAGDACGRRRPPRSTARLDRPKMGKHVNRTPAGHRSGPMEGIVAAVSCQELAICFDLPGELHLVPVPFRLLLLLLE